MSSSNERIVRVQNITNVVLSFSALAGLFAIALMFTVLCVYRVWWSGMIFGSLFAGIFGTLWMRSYLSLCAAVDAYKDGDVL